GGRGGGRWRAGSRRYCGCFCDKERTAIEIGQWLEFRRVLFRSGIAPAGTRTRDAPWRSGFYHIAHAARAPILPVAFDGGARAIRLFPMFETSGDYEADLPRLMALYDGIRGIRE